jgi:hypothetical protein
MGKKDGEGMYAWNDGSKYTGMWNDNKISGFVFLNVFIDLFNRGNMNGQMEEVLKEIG